MDERRHVLWVRLPVVDQLRLTDKLADPLADHRDTHHGAVGRLDELDAAGRLQDLALAVTAQRVGGGVRAAGLLLRLRLGEPDGRDLRLAVGDARDARLIDRAGTLSRDLLG